jgi:hypothetical protein
MLKEKRKSIVKVCPQCGKNFSPVNKSFQKYCSSECLRKHDGKDSKKSFCAIDGCNRPVRARGLCSMHYHRDRRSRGLDSCEPWNERRQANYERRRALKYNNGTVEVFTNIEIFERDHWVCGICGLKVDKDISYPDPKSASLDHVIPLIHGGTHTRGNVQCAHLGCNSMKRDRMEIPLLF